MKIYFKKWHYLDNNNKRDLLLSITNNNIKKGILVIIN